MRGYIYLIRNKINGKGYVGQTIRSIIARFVTHKIDAKKGSKFALHSAMRKYGFDNFEIKEIYSCDHGLLSDMERHFIKFYKTRTLGGYGYNATDGGEGLIGFVHSEETKSRMSICQKGKPKSPELVAKSVAARKGKPYRYNGKRSTPEERKEVQKRASKKWLSKPENKEKHLAAVKRCRQKPKAREAHRIRQLAYAAKHREQERFRAALWRRNQKEKSQINIGG